MTRTDRGGCMVRDLIPLRRHPHPGVHAVRNHCADAWPPLSLPYVH